MVRIRRRSGCYWRLIPLNLCRYTFSGYDPPGFPSTAPPCEQLSNFTTVRGKPAIVHDNNIFTLRRELHDGTLRWRCRQRSCYAAIATDADKKNFVVVRGHNHASVKTCKMELEQVRQSLKRKANDDIGERPSKKVHREISGKEGFFDMNDRYNLSKCIQLERRKLFPQRLPRNLDETLSYLHKQEDNKFIRKVDFENKLVMVGNKDIIACLDNQEHIYCDGTFRNCPKFSIKCIIFLFWKMIFMYLRKIRKN